MKHTTRDRVVLLVALAGCSSPAPDGRAILGLAGERPSIILVTLDTTRADRIGCYGGHASTPTLDGLAARGVRFDQVTSSSPLTLPAHTSILTGAYPPRHGSRDNGVPPPDGGPPSVAETLRASGYATGAFVSAFVLDRRFGLARGFDAYDDGPFASPASGPRHVSMGSLERRCDETVARALAWSARSASRPLFLWVHLFDPHAPYDPPDPYRSQEDRYAAEIAYADACVGRLLGGLQDLRLGDDALVAVVGDHGESLGEHGESTHGVLIYESTLRVPLLLATLGSGGPAVVVEEPVRTVDLVPTLLELAGSPVPDDGTLDGLSLVPVMAGRDDRARPAYAESHFGRLHFGWAELASLRIGERKLIAAPRPELYDLGRDAGETSDLAGHELPTLASMRAQLEDLVAAIGPVPSGTTRPDAEAVEKLAALGYVGTGGGGTPNGADPKDKIGVAEALVAARREVVTGDRRAGMADLEQLIAREPDLVDARFLLGWGRLEDGLAAAAADDFGRTLALNPRYPLGSFHLALALEQMGDLGGAERAYDAALALDPGHSEAIIHRADLLVRIGRIPEARAAYAEAIALSPEAAVLRAKHGGLLLRTGQLADAEHELREAVRLNPQVPVAHFNLALLAERDGRTDEAIASYRRAIAAEPEDIKPLVNLAQLLGAPDQREERVRLLARALELNPDFVPGYALLAGALEAVGDRAAAAEVLRRTPAAGQHRP